MRATTRFKVVFYLFLLELTGYSNGNLFVKKYYRSSGLLRTIKTISLSFDQDNPIYNFKSKESSCESDSNGKVNEIVLSCYKIF